MERRSELTLEQALTSEMSRILEDEDWISSEDEVMGPIQLRGREFEVSNGKIILSQLCLESDLGFWNNSVQVDTTDGKVFFSWLRDGVAKIDRPLELQELMDEIKELKKREDEAG